MWWELLSEDEWEYQLSVWFFYEVWENPYYCSCYNRAIVVRA